MRNLTLQQAEDLFNRIEAKKGEIIAYRMGDQTFVTAHFPYQEFAARKSVNWLSRMQDRLLEQFLTS